MVMQNVTKYIGEYYKGKKNSGVVLIAIGIAMIILAWIGLRNVKGEIVYGLIFGAVPSGVAQILYGLGILIQADLEKSRMLKQIAAKVKSSLIKESKTIESRVLRYTKTRKILEFTFGISFILIFLGMAKVISSIGFGLAVALLLQTAVIIAFNLFAERRTAEYSRRLKHAIDKI